MLRQFNFRDMEFASIAGEMERDSFVPPLPLRHLQKWLDRSSSGSCSQLPEVSKEHLNDGIPCSMGEEFR